MSVIIKIEILIFHVLMYFILTAVKGHFIEHPSTITNNHQRQQNHSEPSIADEVEIFYPNLQQSLPTKQKTRLNKDPKFLAEQVEVFSKKNQTFKTVPDPFDEEHSDARPLKFVSSRPLFVHRNEERKKKQQQLQQQHQQQQNSGYGFAYINSPNPYPYPVSHYTNHGVYHYYPSGR